MRWDCLLEDRGREHRSVLSFGCGIGYADTTLPDHDREEVQPRGEDAMSLLSLPGHFHSWLFLALHNASGHRVTSWQAHETNTPPVTDTNVQKMLSRGKRGTIIASRSHGL